jgi:hypothetical protein
MILRQCPVCLCDSIIGHGRRRKQVHDEDHDWIPIRRGLALVATPAGRVCGGASSGGCRSHPPCLPGIGRRRAVMLFAETNSP